MPRTKHLSSCATAFSTFMIAWPTAFVIFIAGPGIACTGGYGIDPDQPQRQPELRLYGRLSLPRHGDQLFDRTVVQQERSSLVPVEGRSAHIAAPLAHHSIQPQPHLISAFGCKQQHPALALHGMPKPGLPRVQGSAEIEEDKRLAGTP